MDASGTESEGDVKKNISEVSVVLRVKVLVSWGTAFKMFLMGRHPAAIIAKAIADNIRRAK